MSTPIANSAKKQINTLLYCFGEEAAAVLSSTDITEDERKVYDSVVLKFAAFFQVRRKVIFERARFNQRNQLGGETVKQYIMELYKLAESCNYADMTDEMIRDRLVVGIRDSALSQRLQLDTGLMLEKAKTMVHQREAVGEQQQLLKGTGTAETHSLDELQRRNHRKQWKGSRPKRNYNYGKTQTQSKQCQRYERDQHHRDKCPAKEAMCHRCSKKGHYSTQCFSKNMARNMSQVESTNDMDAAYLDTVSASKGSAWLTKIQLNGESDISFKKWIQEQGLQPYR